MRKIPLLALLLAPLLAHATGMSPRALGTPQISQRSSARYFTYVLAPSQSGAGAALGSTVIPYVSGARLVDLIVYQVSAGVGGTSWTIDVRNAAGTSLLSAAAVGTLASGASQKTDAKGEIALPSGWTRPAIKTDGTASLAKGAFLDVYCTESGTYSTHASLRIVLVFESL